MSAWTEHLRGLAELEENIGKKAAFETSAQMIDQLEKEMDELESKLENLRINGDF